MIVFSSEIDFKLEKQEEVSIWISQTIEYEEFELGELNYIFCSDGELLKKNTKFLNHSSLTDIISFDYTIGKIISGDVFISIERVKENAETFHVSFENELHRVMIHGVLHYCGYKDKKEEEKKEMRFKEDFYLGLRKKKLNVSG